MTKNDKKDIHRLIWLWPLFIPLSLLYKTIIFLRKFLYKRKFLKTAQLKGKTISIGNLEAGGTGKSEIVMTVATHLKKRGYKPAILSRGYRSGLKKDDSMVIQGEKVVLPPQIAGKYFADESNMQATILEDIPVIIGANRIQAAQRFLENFPEPTHWILDDGFQHLKIKRDIDIVLLDARRPFHNGHVLPFGRLRESTSSLSRANYILFTRATDDFPSTEAIKLIEKFNIPWQKAKFSDKTPYQITGKTTSFFDIQKITLVTAIAKPDNIRKRIHQLGLLIENELIKMDHKRFNHEELVYTSKNSDAILTTPKDFWRDPTIFHDHDIPVFILPLKIDLSEEELDQMLSLPSNKQ